MKVNKTRFITLSMASMPYKLLSRIHDKRYKFSVAYLEGHKIAVRSPKELLKKIRTNLDKKEDFNVELILSYVTKNNHYGYYQFNIKDLKNQKDNSISFFKAINESL